MVAHILAQIGDALAVVLNERRTTRCKAAACLRTERRSAFLFECREPGFFSPSVRELGCTERLYLLCIVRQKLFLAQHGIVCRLPDSEVLRPRADVGANVALRLRDRCKSRVARFPESRKISRGQLRGCGLRQRAVEEAGHAGELLVADDALQVPRIGHERLRRKNIRRSLWRGAV